MTPRTDYEKFANSSVENRRLLRQEELILDVSVALCDAMDRLSVSRAQLAMRLGKTPAFVTQILSGGRNLTLRTFADVADALNSKVKFEICPNVEKPGDVQWSSFFEKPATPSYLKLVFKPAEDPQIEIPVSARPTPAREPEGEELLAS